MSEQMRDLASLRSHYENGGIEYTRSDIAQLFDKIDKLDRGLTRVRAQRDALAIELDVDRHSFNEANRSDFCKSCGRRRGSYMHRDTEVVLVELERKQAAERLGDDQ